MAKLHPNLTVSNLIIYRETDAHNSICVKVESGWLSAFTHYLAYIWRQDER